VISKSTLPWPFTSTFTLPSRVCAAVICDLLSACLALITILWAPEVETLIEPIWLMTSSALDSGETVNDLLKVCPTAVNAEAVISVMKMKTTKKRRKQFSVFSFQFPVVGANNWKLETENWKLETVFLNIPSALPFQAFDIFQKLAFLVIESENHLLLNAIVRIDLEYLPGTSQ
jgi:hypothetical protein